MFCNWGTTRVDRKAVLNLPIEPHGSCVRVIDGHEEAASDAETVRVVQPVTQQRSDHGVHSARAARRQQLPATCSQLQ